MDQNRWNREWGVAVRRSICRARECVANRRVRSVRRRPTQEDGIDQSGNHNQQQQPTDSGYAQQHFQSLAHRYDWKEENSIHSFTGNGIKMKKCLLFVVLYQRSRTIQEERNEFQNDWLWFWKESALPQSARIMLPYVYEWRRNITDDLDEKH